MKVYLNKEFFSIKKLILSSLIICLMLFVSIGILQIKSIRADAAVEYRNEDLSDNNLEEEIDYYATGWIPESLQVKLSVPEFSISNLSTYSIEMVDYTNDFPNPGNQGKQGSCTAWAVGYAAKSYLVNIGKKWGVKSYQFSPSFIYNQINNGVDEGSSIYDAMQLVINQGVCLLSDMPYNQNDFTTQPTQSQKDLANQYRSLSMRRIADGNVNDMKTVLKTGIPIVIGIPVYPDFDNLKESNPIYDTVSGESRGNHAICLIGYDDNKNAFKFINSWGTSKGLKGYGYISYSLIEAFETTGWVLYDAAIGQFSNSQFSGTELTKYNPINDTQTTISIPLGITQIGDSAFANQTEITSVSLPNTVQSIGNNAFENCTNLTNININLVESIGTGAFKNCSSLYNLYISNTLTDIGQAVFAGCNNLNITVSANNPNYSAEGNILYNQTKTKIVATGRTEQEIVIPNAVTEIMPYAFAENGNLVSVRFASTPKIGEYAFHHCPNLNAVYFDSYEVPVIGENSFSNNNFVLYTRYNAQDAYKNIFAVYTSRIESFPLTITFMSDGQIYDIKTVYNGSTIADLPEPTRTGYEFNGWYDNDSYSGNPYQNRKLWESETDLYVYAKWTPKQSTVTLDADAGTLFGANYFSVNYGEPYSISVTVSKTGYTFEGWYDENNKRYMTASGQGVDVWDKEDAAVTLKAHWAVECYEIQIDDDGSIVWVKASGISDTSCTIEYGTSLNAINLVPIYKASNHGFKEGKIFDHFEYKDYTLDWTSVPDLGDNGAVITIKPCWVYEVHTIYFNANYESESEVKEIKVMFDEAVTLPEIDRIGYIFNGWFESLSDNIRITWLRMPDLTPDEQNNGSTMLYAKWTPITYTVSYKPNGGAGVMSSSTHTYDVYKNLNVNAFYKTGHDFVGWATSQSGGAKYADKASVVNLLEVAWDKVALYAVWQPKTYNIIYKNLMPDTFVIYPHTYTYGEGLTTMPILYRRDSSRYPVENFYGWYSSSDFNTKVNSISSISTGNVYLYAKYDYRIGGIYSPETQTVTDGKIENQPHERVNILLGSYYYNIVKNTTMKKIKIVFSMDIWEVHDGYQDFYLYQEDKIIWETTMEHGPKKNTSVRNYTFTITLDIDEYRNVDWLGLKFGAHGYMGDTWQFNNFELSVYFIN